MEGIFSKKKCHVSYFLFSHTRPETRPALKKFREDSNEEFITNITLSRKRAILGQIVLDLLGLHDVLIGVSTPGPLEYCRAFNYEFEASFMPEKRIFIPNRTGLIFFIMYSLELSKKINK